MFDTGGGFYNHQQNPNENDNSGATAAIVEVSSVLNPHPKGAALEHPPIGGTRPCPQRGRAR
jgi:hypothetical protein